MNPTPTVFQTNKYLHTGDDGGNVPDAFIANLQTSGAGDPILLTVDAAAGSYQVTYGSESRKCSNSNPLNAIRSLSWLSIIPNASPGKELHFLLKNLCVTSFEFCDLNHEIQP